MIFYDKYLKTINRYMFNIIAIPTLLINENTTSIIVIVTNFNAIVVMNNKKPKYIRHHLIP